MALQVKYHKVLQSHVVLMINSLFQIDHIFFHWLDTQGNYFKFFAGKTYYGDEMFPVSSSNEFITDN